MANEKKPRIIVEINNGRVWWVIASQEVEVVAVNHDEGFMWRRPVEIRGEEEINERFELADMAQECGIKDEMEKKLQTIDPHFYARLQKIKEKAQEGGDRNVKK